MAKKKFYAVKVGSVPGIYKTWEECKQCVEGFPGAIFKGFNIKEDAENYMNGTSIEGSKCDKVIAENNASPDESERNTNTPIAYVDGSYDGKTAQYSYGVVILYKGTETYLSGTGQNSEVAKMHNVAGEMLASMHAMKYAKEHHFKEITIVHDYQGIRSWCTLEWKAKNEFTQKYVQFFHKMESFVKISFRKVAGHTNVFYNELADALAKNALGINISKSMSEYIDNHKLTTT